MRLRYNSKDRWTKKEDIKLIDLFEDYGADWKSIAEHFPSTRLINLDRTARCIQDRYVNYADPKIDKSPWTL